MASTTWWTWVWVSSGSWWWTGKPGVLQSQGLQSQTQLSDWTDHFIMFKCALTCIFSLYFSFIYLLFIFVFCFGLQLFQENGSNTIPTTSTTSQVYVTYQISNVFRDLVNDLSGKQSPKQIGYELKGRQNAEFKNLTLHLLYLTFVQIFSWWISFFVVVVVNLFIFNWRVIALQYCVGFCHTTTWINHR